MSATAEPRTPMAGPGAAAGAAIALAGDLLDDARRVEGRAARRRARRLSRLLGDDAGMALVLALTDQVARIADPPRAARRLHDVVTAAPLPASLGPLDRMALRAGAALAGVVPGTVAWAVRRRLLHEASGVVVPAEEPAFTRYLARRRRAGMRLNVNLLGEAVLGDAQARRRLDDVMALVERPDVDYVSVKISSVCARVSSLAFDRSVARILTPLRELVERAASCDPPVFVNLDMEDYRDLALTLAVFEEVMSGPSLSGVDAGLALQAYVPDSHGAFDHLATWARRRHDEHGGHVKVRLVKGANLAMEQVDAELHGWPQAPYTSKAEVDASYTALVERALDPRWGAGVRIGLASHNLFDVAWGVVRAGELGTGDRLEVEMLEGMAPGAAEAVRRRTGHVLLYAPVVRRDELDTAIAYLVRRLDENAGPENFLRHQFDLRAGSPAYDDQRQRFVRSLADRHRIATVPRRSQDRSSGRRRFTLAGPFTNEPDTDWTTPANRAWVAGCLAGTGGSIPEVGAADLDAVHGAVSTARQALEGWSATAPAMRADVLLRCAEELAARRGDAIAVMARETGKTVAQADPEVSEAVDFAAWYARRTVELDERDAQHRPLGPVVVAPPWNFPLSIPAGGTVAALAAGNTVILKPAPEAVRTAALLARCLWDAGVPRDVLQLLPCPDGEVGRALVTHADIGAVILTGSADTAQLFVSWKPELRLHGETSGKNAIVVTAAADLDLAVADVVSSAFGHAGQKCSAASLVIVERSVLDAGRFTTALADATRTLHVAPAMDVSADVGPLIGRPNERLARALTALEPGERWLVEPRRIGPDGDLWSPGIRLGVRPGSFLHRTECFGPVLGVMAARDLDEAIALQNATEFGLTGGLHSLDPAEIDRWLSGVQVGNAYVNRTITGAIVGRQPFGGWKRSSIGPAAKAGGPHYVESLCTWRDHSGDRRSRAAAGFPRAWAALREPQDPSGLRAERNELRHLPLAAVELRIGSGADAADVELCRLAARTTGTDLIVTSAGDEPDDRLLDRWREHPPAHVRALGHVPDAVRRAAHVAWIPLDDRPPVADGAIELPRWCREQAVSITAHRHGNIRTTI